jgi:hypothetical protein
VLSKTSYQREIDRFCEKIAGGDFNIKEVTKGALSQARAKLNPWAFQRLTEVAVNTFYEEADYDIWQDLRILAVDGSRLRLPYSKDIVKEFGEHLVGPKAESKVCMATCSIVYDVLNQVTITSSIGPWSKSELAFVIEDHLEHFKEGDLLLADRYYPSIKLMYTLQERKVHYCFRMKNDWWLDVKKFTESEEIDSIVDFTITSKLSKELGISPEIKIIKARLLKVILDDGSVEILCTSLLDKDKYEYDQLCAIYHLRWAVEEEYKLMKSRVEIEAFTGRTAISVYQDFYAKVFMMAVCSTLSYPIAERVKEEYKTEKTDNKYDQKINRTNSISVTKDNFINLFIKEIHTKTLDLMDYLIEKTRVIIKPFRNNNRNKKPKRLYFTGYKGI